MLEYYNGSYVKGLLQLFPDILWDTTKFISMPSMCTHFECHVLTIEQVAIGKRLSIDEDYFVRLHSSAGLTRWKRASGTLFRLIQLST